MVVNKGKFMRLRSISFVIILIIAITSGCINNQEKVVKNPNYPNITITKDLTSDSFPDMVGLTFSVHVLVTSAEPEKITEYANGSTVFEGNTVTVPITAYVEGSGNKTEYVTLNYSETKEVSIPFNENFHQHGDVKVIVTTPNMSIERSVFVFDGRI